MCLSTNKFVSASLCSKCMNAIAHFSRWSDNYEQLAVVAIYSYTTTLTHLVDIVISEVFDSSVCSHVVIVINLDTICCHISMQSSAFYYHVLMQTGFTALPYRYVTAIILIVHNTQLVFQTCRKCLIYAYTCCCTYLYTCHLHKTLIACG